MAIFEAKIFPTKIPWVKLPGDLPVFCGRFHPLAIGSGRSRTHKHSRFIKGGVQWKQGVVVYMMLYTSFVYTTTPIHCIPLPLHPPVMNTQARAILVRKMALRGLGVHGAVGYGIL